MRIWLGAVGSLVAAAAALASAAVAGAWVDRLAADADPSVRLGLSAGVAGAVAVGVPLVALIGLARALRDRRPRTAALAVALTTTWNLAVLGVLVGALPDATADTLANHGDWFLAGREVPAVTAAARRAGGLLRGGPAAAPAPTADAGAEEARAEAPDLGEELVEAESGPWAPTRVFAERAPSVVVIRAWAPLDDVLAAVLPLAGQLGASQGSGFVVGPDLLVTNFHVIGDATGAEVVLPDGTRRGGLVVVAESRHEDLALVRVEGLGLTAIPLAGALPPVGGPVYAIGAPLGMEATFTEGIVSAHRDVSGTKALQMQTPIAPGSSGGPLLDDHGRVVGVNTATFGAGLNLSVAVDHVRELLAAPPAPRAVPPGPESAELVALTFDGELDPVGRTRLEEIASPVGDALRTCLRGLPADARISIALPAFVPPAAGRGRGAASPEILDSTLGDEADACVREGLRDAGLPLSVLIRALGLGEVRTVGFSWRGVPVAGDPRPPAERTLSLTVELGRASAAAAPHAAP